MFAVKLNVRRKIKRGRPTTRLSTAENSSRDPVVGNSQNGFKLKSSEIQNNPNLHLVYVGRLAKNTSENDVRTHLHEISVTNQGIADVIKLKCRKDNETSFCISLNDTSAQDTLFRSEKWPRGVIVRPFTQNPKKNTKSEQNRRYRDNRQSVPPRLRKQVRLEERAVPVRSTCSRQYAYLRNTSRSRKYPVPHQSWQSTINKEQAQTEEWPTIRATNRVYHQNRMEPYERNDEVYRYYYHDYDHHDCQNYSQYEYQNYDYDGMKYC